MGLRELVIKLAVRADAKQATLLSTTLDTLRGKVSRLDTGLHGFARAASGVGRVGHASMSEFGSAAEMVARALDNLALVSQRVSQRIQADMHQAALAGGKVVTSTEGAGGKTRTGGTKERSRGGGGFLGNVIAGGAGGAIVAGAIALKQYAGSALDAAGRINDLRAATGANAKVIQTWEAIVTQAGGSPETLSKGLRELNKTLVEAKRGNKDAVGAFRDLGVATKNVDGSARPLGTILREAGGALGEMTDASRKAELAAVLFGKAGFELLPAFEGGSAAVDAAVTSFSKMAALSDEQVTKLDATGDSLDTLKLKLGGIGARVLVAFSPLIDVIASAALPLLEALAAALTPVIETIGTGLKPVIASLTPVIEKVFATLGPVFQQVAPIMQQTIAAVAPLITLLANSLVPILSALVPAVLMVNTAFMPLVQQLLPPLVGLVQVVAPLVTFLANVLSTLLGPALVLVSFAIVQVVDRFNTVIKTLKLVGAAFGYLAALALGTPEAVDAAGAKLISSAEQWLGSILSIADRIKEYFAKMWDAVATMGTTAWNAIGLGEPSAKLTVAHQGGPFAGAQAKLPGSTVNNTTTNSTTLEDKRQISVLVQRDSTPTQTANAAASALGGVLDVDRRRIGESMSPGSG